MSKLQALMLNRNQKRI